MVKFLIVELSASCRRTNLRYIQYIRVFCLRSPISLAPIRPGNYVGTDSRFAHLHFLFPSLAPLTLLSSKILPIDQNEASEYPHQSLQANGIQLYLYSLQSSPLPHQAFFHRHQNSPLLNSQPRTFSDFSALCLDHICRSASK